jgi:Lar family restriction alleviation protein
MKTQLELQKARQDFLAVWNMILFGGDLGAIRECPVCGHTEATPKWTKTVETITWTVVCHVCGLQTGLYESEQEAIAAWNIRV